MKLLSWFESSDLESEPRSEVDTGIRDSQRPPKRLRPGGLYIACHCLSHGKIGLFESGRKFGEFVREDSAEV